LLLSVTNILSQPQVRASELKFYIFGLKIRNKMLTSATGRW
jgi:hypothetical protein